MEEAPRLLGIHRGHFAVLDPRRGYERRRVRRNELPPQRLLESRTQGRMRPTDGGRRQPHLEELVVGSLYVHRREAGEWDTSQRRDQVEADVFLVAVP